MGKATKDRRQSVTTPRKTEQTPLQIDLQRCRERSRSAWTRRHPLTAKQERELRKSRAETLEAWDHKREGTPETHEHVARTNEGGLKRLYMKEIIDGDQLASADQITQVRQRIEAEVRVRTVSHEMRVDSSPRYGNALVEGLLMVRLEMAYSHWRKQLPSPAGAILDMITGAQIGYTVAAQRHNISRPRALRLLIQALNAWPGCLQAAYREVDSATLAAAHAALI